MHENSSKEAGVWKVDSGKREVAGSGNRSIDNCRNRIESEGK